jgi:hypothetical protein
MSFYVVLSKIESKKALGTLCTLRTATKRSLMRLRRLERHPKADLGPIYQNYDFMQSLYAEKDLLATPLRKQLDIVISV